MEIRGSTAVATDGASGIGRAIVRTFLSKGARVAIFDLNEGNDRESLREQAAAMRFSCWSM
jgi:NAD(P)-dependent dehydrogenase (short-subunit alcohol dehydrogenase family)